MSNKIDSKYGEVLAKWYLRLNGYFIVENFIVHAGDDESRVSKGIVGNYTEADLLSIRHRFSKEVTGSLHVQNDKKLIDVNNGLIDFVIAEVKTGGEDRPNKFWLEKKLAVIEYILRFAGFLDSEEKISKVSYELSIKGFYYDPEEAFSTRLVLISESKANRNWKHITNILFDDIIDFFISVRGACWFEENIGIASIHRQWDPLIIEIFSIANDQRIDRSDMKLKIRALIEQSENNN